MEIKRYSFGRIDVNGHEFKSDVIIFPERAQDNWRRREGHRLDREDLRTVLSDSPDILVVDTGYYGPDADSRRNAGSPSLKGDRCPDFQYWRSGGGVQPLAAEICMHRCYLASNLLTRLRLRKFRNSSGIGFSLTTNLTHSFLDGDTPAEIAGGTPKLPLELNEFRWQIRCRGLCQLPKATKYLFARCRFTSSFGRGGVSLKC